MDRAAVDLLPRRDRVVVGLTVSYEYIFVLMLLSLVRLGGMHGATSLWFHVFKITKPHVLL